MTTTVYTPITAPPPGGGRLRQFGLRSLIAASALVGALLLVSSYVFAQLNAEATQADTARTGTLSLTMAANGVGFTTDLGTAGDPMAPGDKFVRSVTLWNGGTLDAIDLKLGVSTPATNYLVDSTHGLRVTVDSCPSAWVLSNPSPPAMPSWGCSGSPTNVLPATTIATLKTTPQLLAAAMGDNTYLYLRFTIELPNSPANDETVTNGSIPSPGIQGITAALTWNFTEVQRTAQTVEA